MKRPPVLLALLAVLLAFPAFSRAGGIWLAADSPEALLLPPETSEEYTGTLRVTFLGDCTLGGLESKRNAPSVFEGGLRKTDTVFPSSIFSR